MDLYERLKDHLDYVQQAISGWMTENQRAMGLNGELIFSFLTKNWENQIFCNAKVSFFAK